MSTKQEPPSNPRIWVRWRHTFNTGDHDDWTWWPWKDEATLKELFIEEREEYDWSEHYRGIEWHYDEVPDAVLQQMIEEQFRAMDAARGQITALKVLLMPEPLRAWEREFGDGCIRLYKDGVTLVIGLFSGHVSSLFPARVVRGSSTGSVWMTAAWMTDIRTKEEMMLAAVTEYERLKSAGALLNIEAEAPDEPSAE